MSIPAVMGGSNEQWKNDGECKFCRRRPYCKKRCKAANNKISEMLHRGLFSDVLTKEIEKYGD